MQENETLLPYELLNKYRKCVKFYYGWCISLKSIVVAGKEMRRARVFFNFNSSDTASLKIIILSIANSENLN